MHAHSHPEKKEGQLRSCQSAAFMGFIVCLAVLEAVQNSSVQRSFPSLLSSNLCSAVAGLPPYRQACVLLFIYFLDVSGLIITEETHQSRSLFLPLATFYIFCLFKKRKKRKTFLEVSSI